MAIQSPAFVVPPTGTVGSAFAALNPPVHAMQAASPESPPSESTRPMRKPDWKTRTCCGVVTVSNQALWHPKGSHAVPPSCMDNCGMYLSSLFAQHFNQSDHARTKRRWALVTNRGTVLILNGIAAADRPVNPADFPSCVQGGLTYSQAELATGEANGPRHALAIVPREWTISVRRADSVDDQPSVAVEGGGV